MPAAIQPLESRVLLTASASLISDLVPGTNSGATYSSGQFVDAGGIIYFAGPGGLWKTDGTAGGTSLVKAIATVPGGQIVSMIAGTGATAYFVANDGSGSQVWQTDGTAGGTVKITDLSGGESPGQLRFGGTGHVFFVTLSTDPGVWQVDSVGPGQTLLAPLTDITMMPVVDGFLYLQGSSQDGLKNGLWGTNGSTVNEIKDFTFGDSDALSGVFSAAYNHEIYFQADQADGFEPWVSDGSTTVELADVDPGTDSSFPVDFTVSNHTLYFVAGDGSGEGDQIFSTTGIGATAVTATPGNYSQLTDVDGTLYYVFQAPNASSGRLYKLGSNVPIPLGTDGGTSPLFLTAVGSNVYFAATGSDNARHLFVSDGSSVTEVGGDAGTNPIDLAALGGNLLYVATDATHGAEPHLATDTTPPPPVFDAELRANGHTSATVNEGSTVSFDALVDGVSRDQVSKYYWFFQGAVGAPVIEGPKPSFTYANNLPNNAPIDVRCKVVLKDGRVANAHANVTVKNVGPSGLQITLPKVTITFGLTPITITWTDPGKDNWDLKVNWGDGVIEDDGFDLTNTSAKKTHVYKSYSTETGRTVSVIITDTDGASTTIQQRIKVRPLSTVITEGKLNIDVGGTSGNDKLSIVKSAVQPTDPKLITFDIILNGKTIFTARNVTKNSILDAEMGPGNDEIDVDTAISVFGIDFDIVGGSGSDTLNGKPIK